MSLLRGIWRCVFVLAICSAAAGAERFDMKSDSPEAFFQVKFDPPVNAAKKERLVIEARGIDSRREGVVISRLMLHGENPEQVLTYEPDIRFPFFWSLREILLDAFEGDRKVLESVRDVEFVAWMPAEVGESYSFVVRQCEFQDLEEVCQSLSAASLPKFDRASLTVRPSGAAAGRWVNFGPGGGGWLRTVAISPHDGTFFAGCDVGGIYRSADRGKSWRAVNEGLFNLYCQTLAFHPKDKNIIYAGTRGGVAKSTDGGGTWTMKREGFPALRTFGLSAPVSAVAVDPVRPEMVYAGVGLERSYGALPAKTDGGCIYKSTDAAEHWRKISLPDAKGQSVTCLTFGPAEAKGTLYAATPRMAYASRDAGETWTPLADALKGHHLTFLIVKRDDPQAMLLGYSSSSAGRGGVLKSTDGGRSWTDSSKGLPPRPGLWMLATHPSNAATCFAAYHKGGGICVSNDFGGQWRPLNTVQNVTSAWFFTGLNATGICVDPRDGKTLLYCNDMDIYLTTDGGASWGQIATDLVQPATEDHPPVWRGRGIETTCASDLAVDPRNPQTIYFSYWDTNLWKSADGGRTCCWLTDGLGSNYGRVGCIALDPEYPDVVYVSKGRNYEKQRIYKSIDAGRRFRLIGCEKTGLPPGAIFSLEIDPTSPPESRTLYAAVTGYGVYRSDDGGFHWSEASNGLPPKSRKVVKLVMAPRDPKRMFVAARFHYHTDTKERSAGYVARTLDGGQHWEVVLSDLEATCVLIDPFDPNRIYAGNRDFSGCADGKALFKSTDGGKTWTSLPRETLLDSPGSRGGDQGERIYVTCLAADHSRNGVVYCACTEESYDVNNGRSVFVSQDHGETWQSFKAPGLDNYRISVLTVDPVDPSRLYVGTGGDGFFRLER